MAGVVDQITAGVLTLTLENERKKNAASQAMVQRLVDLLRNAAIDPGIRAIVLRGAGSDFCSGGDVSALGKGNVDDPLSTRLAEDPVWNDMEMRTVRLRRNAEVSTLLNGMSKPTIAMLRGVVAGGGMSFACACDFRIGSNTTVFTSAFARIAVSGDVGIGYFLQKLVGPSKAREILFLSKPIQAQEAHRIGLMDYLVADDQLEAECTAFASVLAAGPAVAYGYIKQNLSAAQWMSLENYLDFECRNMIRCFQTADHREALDARISKRTPAFKGR